MSRLDLVHVLTALRQRADGRAGVGVSVAAIDEAIGRGRGDMRTALNLQGLASDGLAEELPGGAWALTPAGLAWLEQDRELSGR